jgi:hypothetical protein
MNVHRYQLVNASRFEHASDCFGAYRLALKKDSVLARVRQVRYNGGYFFGAVSFRGVRHQRKLNESSILRRTRRLNYSDLFVLQLAFQPQVVFAIWKSLKGHGHGFGLQSLGDLFTQLCRSGSKDYLHFSRRSYNAAGFIF